MRGPLTSASRRSLERARSSLERATKKLEERKAEAATFRHRLSRVVSISPIRLDRPMTSDSTSVASLTKPAVFTKLHQVRLKDPLPTEASPPSHADNRLSRIRPSGKSRLHESELQSDDLPPQIYAELQALRSKLFEELEECIARDRARRCHHESCRGDGMPRTSADIPAWRRYIGSASVDVDRSRYETPSEHFPLSSSLHLESTPSDCESERSDVGEVEVATFTRPHGRFNNAEPVQAVGHTRHRAARLARSETRRTRGGHKDETQDTQRLDE
ncbi:hypothetical protein FOL47_010422, partial [Perkinsus chesapeaki]